MSKDLTDALDALSRRERQRPVKKPAERGSAPRQISAATPGGGAAQSNGGAAFGDLTEESVAQRLYYPDGWSTSDGLFTLPAIKRVVMKDKDGVEVTLVFAAP